MRYVNITTIPVGQIFVCPVGDSFVFERKYSVFADSCGGASQVGSIHRRDIKHYSVLDPGHRVLELSDSEFKYVHDSIIGLARNLTDDGKHWRVRGNKLTLMVDGHQVTLWYPFGEALDVLALCMLARQFWSPPNSIRL